MIVRLPDLTSVLVDLEVAKGNVLGEALLYRSVFDRRKLLYFQYYFSGKRIFRRSDLTYAFSIRRNTLGKCDIGGMIAADGLRDRTIHCTLKSLRVGIFRHATR